MNTPFKILICDLVGLKFGIDGKPDPTEVKAHIEAKGGAFHEGAIEATQIYASGLHFFYLPDISTEAEILALTDQGQFDGVIAAATFVPKQAIFNSGGVRIGAGTGNMASASWGGGNGLGGQAPLMNTPGFNSRATAQMAFKALLRVRPDLPVAALHRRVIASTFDTGKHLRDYPTAKLEGQIMAVLGYGNIGREMAKLAQAFGMVVKVFARNHHKQQIEADGFAFAATPEHAAKGADVISVHVGLGKLDSASAKFSNTGFIGENVLNCLNPNAVLINYDRGECVDVGALEAAMASGQVGHACIDADIFINADGTLRGPLVPYLPLAEKYEGRVALLPHAAADTDHPSRVAGAKQAVDQIIDCIVHKRVTNLVGELPSGYVNAGVKLGV